MGLSDAGELRFTSNDTVIQMANAVDNIAALVVPADVVLRGSADVLDGIRVEGAGSAEIADAAGSQLLQVFTEGENIIFGGTGNSITLGEGTGYDQIVIDKRGSGEHASQVYVDGLSAAHLGNTLTVTVAVAEESGYWTGTFVAVHDGLVWGAFESQDEGSSLFDVHVFIDGDNVHIVRESGDFAVDSILVSVGEPVSDSAPEVFASGLSAEATGTQTWHAGFDITGFGLADALQNNWLSVTIDGELFRAVYDGTEWSGFAFAGDGEPDFAGTILLSFDEEDQDRQYVSVSAAETFTIDQAQVAVREAGEEGDEAEEGDEEQLPAESLGDVAGLVAEAQLDITGYEAVLEPDSLADAVAGNWLAIDVTAGTVTETFRSVYSGDSWSEFASITEPPELSVSLFMDHNAGTLTLTSASAFTVTQAQQLTGAVMQQPEAEAVYVEPPVPASVDSLDLLANADVITNFEIGTDILALPFADPLVSDSIENGVLQTTSPASFIEIIGFLMEISSAGTPKTIAFATSDHDGMFVFHSDGEPGFQTTDTLVHLIGVSPLQVDNLGDILLNAGPAPV